MSIYREEILDHYKHPRNFGELSAADATVQEENMPCGDHLTLALKLRDEKIEEVKFMGSGCALSIACTSMLTESIRNNTIAQVEIINESDILNFIGGAVSPGRLNCVLLGWKALKKAIAEVKKQSRSPGEASSAGEARVSRDMNLGEIAARWPAARSVLLDYGLHCVGCFASSFDTLEEGARVHGMSEEEIEEMVKEVNHAITRSTDKS